MHNLLGIVSVIDIWHIGSTLRCIDFSVFARYGTVWFVFLRFVRCGIWCLGILVPERMIQPKTYVASTNGVILEVPQGVDTPGNESSFRGVKFSKLEGKNATLHDTTLGYNTIAAFAGMASM